MASIIAGVSGVLASVFKSHEEKVLELAHISLLDLTKGGELSDEQLFYMLHKGFALKASPGVDKKIESLADMCMKQNDVFLRKLHGLSNSQKKLMELCKLRPEKCRGAGGLLRWMVANGIVKKGDIEQIITALGWTTSQCGGSSSTAADLAEGLIKRVEKGRFETPQKGEGDKTAKRKSPSASKGGSQSASKDAGGASSSSAQDPVVATEAGSPSKKAKTSSVGGAAKGTPAGKSRPKTENSGMLDKLAKIGLTPLGKMSDKQLELMLDTLHSSEVAALVNLSKRHNAVFKEAEKTSLNKAQRIECLCKPELRPENCSSAGDLLSWMASKQVLDADQLQRLCDKMKIQIGEDKTASSMAALLIRKVETGGK